MNIESLRFPPASGQLERVPPIEKERSGEPGRAEVLRVLKKLCPKGALPIMKECGLC